MTKSEIAGLLVVGAMMSKQEFLDIVANRGILDIVTLPIGEDVIGSWYNYLGHDKMACYKEKPQERAYMISLRNYHGWDNPLETKVYFNVYDTQYGWYQISEIPTPWALARIDELPFIST